MTGVSFAGNINNTPNYALTSVAPTITSCGSGTLAAGSTGNKGQITGITAATACTISFNTALSTAPACTFTTNAAISPTLTSISTTQAVVAMTALTGTLYYICF